MEEKAYKNEKLMSIRTYDTELDDKYKIYKDPDALANDLTE